MVPVERAVETLVTGFDLGVNIVHTAPDYAGAHNIVAEAIRQSRRDVCVCSNGWGTIEFFEHLFEETRRQFGKPGRPGTKQLEMFGIASVEDREILEENVWGEGGMIEFLMSKKREGKLLNTFCTSHGSPAYIQRLIESNAFDAVMFAYNPLGYHMLSGNPPDDRDRESVAGNSKLFEIAAAYDVGVMLMEVLGGGLLCNGVAFPARTPPPPSIGESSPLPRAGEILRHILSTQPTATCLLPGTASVEEARENAMAGYADTHDGQAASHRIEAAAAHLLSTVCCRCGACEPLCSQHLPISWMFRSAIIGSGGAVPFEIPPRGEYFDLHPAVDQAICDTCADVTCSCPYGIDIPTQLIDAHAQMWDLRLRGQVPGPTPPPSEFGLAAYTARLVSAYFDGRFATVVVQNMGTNGWHDLPGHPAVEVQLREDGDFLAGSPMRADVPTASYGYFVFDVPQRPRDTSGIWIVFRRSEPELLSETRLGQLTMGDYR
ncbi:hypothetical protein XI08_14985 [Bradyrhizobium sp. CCBAU 11361]|nr:hypothetical protein [Bradyrhizobium sp. CCBAU 11361]